MIHGEIKASPLKRLRVSRFRVFPLRTQTVEAGDVTRSPRYHSTFGTNAVLRTAAN